MQVYTVKKSRKEFICNKCGQPIIKGSSYIWWQHMHSPEVRWHAAHGHPRPSDLASSDKVARYCTVQEQVEDAMSALSNDANADNVEELVQGLAQAMREGAEEIRSVGEEYTEAADNMESAFPNGSSVIDEIREKADTCEAWADNLESAADTVEAIDTDAFACDTCDGSGTVECESCSGAGDYDCDTCNGTGAVEPGDDGDTDCRVCDGTGRVECSDCEGTGELDCPDCDGTGDNLQSIIDEAQTAVDEAMSETL